MSTHNVCFYGELDKIIPEVSPNTPLLLFACWVILHAFFCRLWIFFLNYFFSKKSFRNTIRFCGPDLAPNSLQMLSADDKSRH